MSFIDDTDLTSNGPNAYRATLSQRWRSMLDLHGGYVAGVAARAMELTVDDPTRPLRSVTVQFIKPAHAGDVTIHVDVVRAGRSATFLRTTVRQDDTPVLITSAVAAAARDGRSFMELTRPLAFAPTPPPSADRFTGPEDGLHFTQMEWRIEPGLTIFGSHPQARVAGWLRPLDHTEAVTTPWLVCATDFMPPSMVFRTDRPVGAATIDLAVQLVCSDPGLAVDPGCYVFAEMTCAVSAEGYAVEDGTFWNPDGRLLATSRQVRLAGIP